MKRIAFLAVILAAGAAPLHAQRLAPSRFEAALPALPALAAVPAVPATAATAAPALGRVAAPAAHVDRADDEQKEGSSNGLFSFRTLAHVVGGAVVGGWVGYVGAQVARSDWDKESNSALSDQRSAWVAGGAVLGILGSRLIGRTSPPVLGPLQPRPRADRNVLTTEEIQAASVTDAYDLILNLRKDWLITRGTNSWAETTRGEIGTGAPPTLTPGRSQIIVYLNGARIGGVDSLRDVNARLLTRAEFLDGRRATQRFGSGHAHGAILLSTSAT